MKTLLALWYSILGFLRIKGNSAVDLRYAGAEQSARINASIVDLETQRNQVAARGILLEGKIKETKSKVQQSLDAVRHHASVGNDALKANAYADYTKFQSELNTLEADELDIRKQVEDIDAEIKTLKSDAADAKNQLGKAATQQLTGKAMASVEAIHSNINSGPLSEVIEQSKLNSAEAEAARRVRKENDNSATYAYAKDTNILSMDDILNTAK